MVTRVVGASFTITAYSGDTDYSVVVKTGNEASETTTFNLVPNEMLIFNREKALFKRLDINSREILNYVPTIEASYKFEDTPVATVFQQIGKSYGLKIDMEESLFNGCELTSNLTDEPLFEKLNIVCNAVGPGTSYVVEEGRIRIISKGCNL
ncbi:FecR domain-containing protein [Telluribacter humicola]|uniref:FecR domain-containing protein n=1 Tax=Telluribacter humicola TaxID=1720261 RepID=UPI001A95E397|nr:FecR domain-containing protein [Telluribacter humicola]